MGQAGRSCSPMLSEIELNRSKSRRFRRRSRLFLLSTSGRSDAGGLVVAVLTGISQAGANFTFKPLAPKFSKMDPLKGIKRAFPPAGRWWSWSKACSRWLVVAGLAGWTIRGMFSDYIPLLDQEIGQIFLYLMKQTFKLSIRIALLMLAMAVLDYLWQRYEHRTKLRMSRQEMKEERKQQEGDPMIKSRIRSIQMESARKRMMQDVKEADVVVTNPMHLAVALKYEPATMARRWWWPRARAWWRRR